MPDILLFGATGYTGRMTAQALARKGTSFAIAGRDPAKLEALAATVDDPEVRVAAVGDVRALTEAAGDVRVLVSCVGPFAELGDTAAEAAVNAGVHYIDSTGEGAFVARLIERFARRAEAAGTVMAPALGFDEVPADFAATLATNGMERPDLVLTYAFPSSGSRGTIRSSLGILTTKAPWIVDGRRAMVGAGTRERWAPMPPPLGPRRAVSFPFAEAHLAPLHLDLRSLELYGTIGNAQRIALKASVPALRFARALPPVRAAMDAAVGRVPEGPTDDARRRSKWTVLAEARTAGSWRNVALQGTDPYGLTAEFLAAGALRMVEPGFDATGVVAPVQVFGLEHAEKLLTDVGVTIHTYEPKEGE